MRKQPATGQSGFSLIEVVAAMSVLAFSVAALLKLSSGGLMLSRAAEDKTALVAAADGMMRALLAGSGKEPFMQSGGIECHGEVFPFKQGKSGRMVKIIVTAANRTTGARFTLTSLKRE